MIIWWSYRNRMPNVYRIVICIQRYVWFHEFFKPFDQPSICIFYHLCTWDHRKLKIKKGIVYFLKEIFSSKPAEHSFEFLNIIFRYLSFIKVTQKDSSWQTKPRARLAHNGQSTSTPPLLTRKIFHYIHDFHGIALCICFVG